MLDTDSTYLVMAKSRSRISGYYYLGNKPNAKSHSELNSSIIFEYKHLIMLLHPLPKQKQGGYFTISKWPLKFELYLKQWIILNLPLPLRLIIILLQDLFITKAIEINQNLGICNIIGSDTEIINVNSKSAVKEDKNTMLIISQDTMKQITIVTYNHDMLNK